jgi:hypothetical protein
MFNLIFLNCKMVKCKILIIKVVLEISTTPQYKISRWHEKTCMTMVTMDLFKMCASFLWTQRVVTVLIKSHNSALTNSADGIQFINSQLTSVRALWISFPSYSPTLAFPCDLPLRSMYAFLVSFMDATCSSNFTPLIYFP